MKKLAKDSWVICVGLGSKEVAVVGDEACRWMFANRKLVRLRAKRARLDKRIAYLERKLSGQKVRMRPRRVV